MFKPGDIVRLKDGHLTYKVINVIGYDIGGTPVISSMCVESEFGGLYLIDYLTYFELVEPAQVVPAYMELFL